MKLIGNQKPVAHCGFFFLCSLPALIFILASCGSPPPTQPAFVPIRPDPTSTPILISNRGTPTNPPTPVVSDQVAINHYTHFTNRFSINYPENWQPFERPNGVVFLEPGNQVGYSVNFSDVGQRYTKEELTQYLVSFVAKNFAGAGSNFAAISQEQKTDGSVVAQFSSRDPDLGQTISEVRVQQKDTIVFVILINATEIQWKISHEKLQELVDTFIPLDSGPVVEVTATPEVPVWVLIGPTNNKFGFFYPSDWKMLRRDETSVAVAMPDTNLVFEAKILEQPDATGNEAAQKAALAYVKDLAKEYTNVQNLPPQEFPLDTVTGGATIDFLYTDKDGSTMAGSIITAAENGHIYQIVFTSSAQAYQAALQWFNPMYKSFKILRTEEVVTPGP